VKTVRMVRDFIYRPRRHVSIKYLGGATYHRVPESAVKAITSADAGEVVEADHE